MSSRRFSVDMEDFGDVGSKYTAEKIMMLLDNTKMDTLEKQFGKPDGIDLQEFVFLLQAAIPHPPEERTDLVVGLCELFHEVDINGDGHMEWGEFTNYIIEAVMGTNKAEVLVDVDRPRLAVQEKEAFEKRAQELARAKIGRFKGSSHVDGTSHENEITCLRYFKEIDTIGSCERGSRMIRLYTSDGHLLRTLTPPDKENADAILLACDYSPDESWIGAATSDNFLIFFDVQLMYKQMKKIPVSPVQTNLWYVKSNKRWVSTGFDNILRIWDVHSQSEGELLKLKGHTDKIMDLIELPLLKHIVTCSLDRSIRIWDCGSGELIGVLEGHQKGIRTLSYSVEFQCLISTGFELSAYIWAPESTNRNLLGKLIGHAHPVVAGKVLDGQPVAATIDDKCNIRIWDLRSYVCVQIVNDERLASDVNQMISLPSHSLFVVGGRRLHWFETQQSSSNHQRDEDRSAFTAVYNDYYNSFATVTKSEVRIWDARTGQLKKIYDDLVEKEKELTAFCLDDRNRKFFLGDHKGDIRVCSFSNGGIIKGMDKHKREVSYLQFVPKDRVLLTASWDSTIKIHDDRDPDSADVLRSMIGGHKEDDIQCVAFSHHLLLLASASHNGLLQVWDFELGKLIGSCLGHRREITSLTFLDPYPALASADRHGNVCIWGVRPCKIALRYVCVFRFINMSIENVRHAAVMSMVSRVQYHHQPSRGRDSTADSRTSSRPTTARATGHSPNQMNHNHSNSEHHNDHHHQSTDYNHNHLNGGNSNGHLLVPSNLLQTSFSPSSHEEDVNNHFGGGRKSSISSLKAQKKMSLPSDRRESNPFGIPPDCYLYLADERGNVRCIDLTQILNQSELTAVDDQKKKQTYKPHRILSQDASAMIADDRGGPTPRSWPEPIAHELIKAPIQWSAHNECIRQISKIEAPEGLITTSYDCCVKIWSMRGELWGCLYVAAAPYTPSNWTFPIDLNRKRSQDIERARSVLTHIENDQSQSSLPQSMSMSASGNGLHKTFVTSLHSPPVSPMSKQMRPNNLPYNGMIYAPSRSPSPGDYDMESSASEEHENTLDGEHINPVSADDKSVVSADAFRNGKTQEAPVGQEGWVPYIERHPMYIPECIREPANLNAMLLKKREAFRVGQHDDAPVKYAGRTLALSKRIADIERQNKKAETKRLEGNQTPHTNSSNQNSAAEKEAAKKLKRRATVKTVKDVKDVIWKSTTVHAALQQAESSDDFKRRYLSSLEKSGHSTSRTQIANQLNISSTSTRLKQGLNQHSNQHLNQHSNQHSTQQTRQEQLNKVNTLMTTVEDTLEEQQEMNEKTVVLQYPRPLSRKKNQQLPPPPPLVTLDRSKQARFLRQQDRLAKLAATQKLDVATGNPTSQDHKETVDEPAANRLNHLLTEEHANRSGRNRFNVKDAMARPAVTGLKQPATDNLEKLLLTASSSAKTILRIQKKMGQLGTSQSLTSISFHPKDRLKKTPVSDIRFKTGEVSNLLRRATSATMLRNGSSLSKQQAMIDSYIHQQDDSELDESQYMIQQIDM
eukprot:GILK01010078.1.p1 GENE.GILK01010078.1~~GILK01010078.1.p1  ORF type:complete len:1529 (+),score=350.86 GILK01010078.1:164-4750(+)